LDSSRFVLIDEDNTSILKGRVTEDQIHTDAQGIDFGVNLAGCKLIGDQLFALHIVQDNRTHWNYAQYDLGLNSAHKVNEWSISEWSGALYDYSSTVWSNNKMYFARQFGSNFSIVVFDAELRTWSNTEFIGRGFVNTLEIDENDVLTVSATKYLDNRPGIKTVYRLLMRKPDKLHYLAWNTIRRGALFFDSKLYEKFSTQLPFNSEFRPFDES